MPTAPVRRRRAPVRIDKPPARLLVGVEEAATRLDINPRTLRRWVADGKLQAYWVGRLLKVDVADVDALARPVQPGEVSA